MTPTERQEFIADIAAALRSNAPMLTDDELHWVRLAIQREAQAVKLRQAIIEKTTTVLLLGALAWVGSVILEWAKAHGFKP
jgi:hypothetical protein